MKVSKEIHRKTIENDDDSILEKMIEIERYWSSKFLEFIENKKLFHT